MGTDDRGTCEIFESFILVDDVVRTVEEARAAVEGQSLRSLMGDKLWQQFQALDAPGPPEHAHSADAERVHSA